MKQMLFSLTIFLFSCGVVYAHKSDSLQQYTGKYKFPEGSAVSEVIVTIENGSLVMNASIGTASLEKKSDDEFAIPSYSGTATFKRNDAKKIIGVHIEASGIILDGVKDETDAIKKIKDDKVPEPLPLIPILEDIK